MAINCQVVTPRKYVIQMLDFIRYKENIFDKRVLENSCGEGNILLEVVKRYIKDAKKQGMNDIEIIKGIERNIVGYEIDEDKIEICINRLNDFTKKLGFQNINWNIHREDFLKCSKDKYDFIIGNPPYITYHNLDEIEREYLRNHFISCKDGRFDYSYAFVEASIEALDKNGKLVYLLPYSVIKNKFADKLRTYISPYITDIYDYTGIKIFPDAITSSVILVMQKAIKYHLIKNNQERKILRTKLSGKWNLTEENRTVGKRFGDYFEVCNSVATLYNKAYLIERYEEIDECFLVNGHPIEKQIVYPAISMKSYNSNKDKDIKTLILFPYSVKNEQVQHFSAEEFETNYPMAAKHLKLYENNLKKRKSDDKALWFEYGRSQAISKVFGCKLIIPMVITNHVSVCYAQKDEIPYAGYFIKCKQNSNMTLSQANEILESEIFYQYVKDCGTPTTPTSYRISVNDIKEYRF